MFLYRKVLFKVTILCGCNAVSELLPCLCFENSESTISIGGIMGQLIWKFFSLTLCITNFCCILNVEGLPQYPYPYQQNPYQNYYDQPYGQYYGSAVYQQPQ